MSAVGEVVPNSSVWRCAASVRAAAHALGDSRTKCDGTGIQCCHCVVFSQISMHARCSMVAGVVQARRLVIVLASQIVHLGGFAKALLN